MIFSFVYLRSFSQDASCAANIIFRSLTVSISHFTQFYMKAIHKLLIFCTCKLTRLCNPFNSFNNFLFIPDKQQDIDLPSLQVDEVAEARAKKKDKPRHAGPATTMSQVRTTLQNQFVFLSNYNLLAWISTIFLILFYRYLALSAHWRTLIASLVSACQDTE